MELKDGIPTFYADSQKSWRNWLEVNHQREKAVWLIIYKKDSKVPSVYYSEAVDEALCFGWVDSKPNKRDGQSYFQYFSKRNPKSNWSRVNKEKVQRLLDEGLMAPAGIQLIAQAKENGAWTALDEVENLIVPADLQDLFDQNPRAFENWEQFPPSARRGILEWIFNAKRSATRQKRIRETVDLATQNIRANSYRK